MKLIWENKREILKHCLIKLLVSGGIIGLWIFCRGTENLLENLFFVLGVIFAYMAWKQYIAMEGIGARFISPGGYSNSLVTDSAVRDNRYEDQRQATMDSADFSKFISSLLMALVFLIPSLIALIH